MSPRLARIEAMVFRAESVRFEACPTFRAGEDSSLCACGWLECDHVSRTATVNRERRFPRRRSERTLVRRAS